MIDIATLQRDQYAWARKNFGPCRSRWPLMGIAEETGELLHSQLKQEQGIRGAPQEHEAKKKDAVADITIYLFEYCSCMGWQVVDLLVEEETTLEEVQAHVEESEPVWDCLGKIIPLAYDPRLNGDNVLAQEDAVQLLLNLAIYCQRCGWSLQELVETTWLRVSQRDWTKNKKDGGDTIDEDDKKLGDYLKFLKSDKGRAALRRSITGEIDKWREDPNYIPILPGPVPFEQHQLGVMGSPGPLSSDCEIFILSSDDPHAPSALYGYSESLRNGYPATEKTAEIASDDKKADEIWQKADRWGHEQYESRTAFTIIPRAGLRTKTDGTKTMRLDSSKPNLANQRVADGAGAVSEPNTFLTPDGQPPKEWDGIPKPG